MLGEGEAGSEMVIWSSLEYIYVYNNDKILESACHAGKFDTILDIWYSFGVIRLPYRQFVISE